MDIESVAQDLVDAAIQVHRTLGPGLLESAYQACLAHDLTKRGRRVECELPLPLEYDGVRIDAGYRLDMRVDGLVLVENKVVETLLPVHQAQLITYLKLTGLSLGFLINWNVTLLRDGIKHVVLNHPSRSMSRHAWTTPSRSWRLRGLLFCALNSKDTSPAMRGLLGKKTGYPRLSVSSGFLRGRQSDGSESVAAAERSNFPRSG